MCRVGAGTTTGTTQGSITDAVTGTGDTSATTSSISTCRGRPQLAASEDPFMPQGAVEVQGSACDRLQGSPRAWPWRLWA